MLALGIDPGTYRMGVGAVESDGDDYTLALSEVLAPPRRAELAERLLWLHERLDAIIGETAPDVVAVESPFVGRNVKAAIAVGQAQAVAMMAAAARGVPVASYSPGEVKKAVTDHGGSSKEQVQEMVGAMLGLDEVPGPSDRADALAVAICHLSAARELDIEMWE